MDYIATKLTPLKSYPTYQLHAFVSGVKISSESAFKICILEVMRWIKKRLEDLPQMPDILNVPLPEQYEQFRLDDLSSFELDTGVDVKSVYISEQRLWTFSITETDMGANLGSVTERSAVKGRTFCTDVSFCDNGSIIETGVRIMCSEPVDSEAACEVFRPTFIKMIAENPLIDMRTVYPLSGKRINADTKSSAELLSENILNEKNDIPFVIIAEAGFETAETQESDDTGSGNIPTIDEILSSRIDHKAFVFDKEIYTNNIEIDFSKIDSKLKPPGEMLKKKKDAEK